jgi:hypothetical protein
MPFDFKNPERDAEFERAKQEREAALRRKLTLAEELNLIAKQCAALPIISDMTDDEILGYDEFGAPTR